MSSKPGQHKQIDLILTPELDAILKSPGVVPGKNQFVTLKQCWDKPSEVPPSIVKNLMTYSG